MLRCQTVCCVSVLLQRWQSLIYICAEANEAITSKYVTVVPIHCKRGEREREREREGDRDSSQDISG